MQTKERLHRIQNRSTEGTALKGVLVAGPDNHKLKILETWSFLFSICVVLQHFFHSNELSPVITLRQG